MSERKTITNEREYAASVLALSILLAGNPHRKQISNLILSITEYVGMIAEREGRDRAELDAL
ncbi:hypothetical protein [Streptomyces tsukubensis]|uniref:hypothetical protein n=1 Tax=Streptomyces tsukubensis TaxID=83656 RepID=UPI00344CCBFA